MTLRAPTAFTHVGYLMCANRHLIRSKNIDLSSHPSSNYVLISLLTISPNESSQVLMTLRAGLWPFHEDPAVTGTVTLVLDVSTRLHPVPNSGSQSTGQ